jgi:hypothetical protein
MPSIGLTFAATIAVGLLAACSGNAGSPSTTLPSTGGQGRFVSFTPLAKRTAGRFNPDTTTHLYVADEASNAVTSYDHAGNFFFTINKDVSGPDSLAFDSSLNLYVSNLTGNDVTRYPEFENSPNLTITGATTECPIEKPTAVAVGSADNSYIANSGNNSVAIFDQTGGWAQCLSSSDGIQNPQALAFDSKGNLYVANGATSSNNGSVTVYSGSPPNRKLFETITTNIDNPKALAIDKSDNLYVANDVTDGSVWEYPAGKAPIQWGTGYHLRNPNALVFDLRGDLCVSDPGENEVLCFEKPTIPYRILERKAGHINNPVSLAIGPGEGWLRVANDVGTNGSVTEYCPVSSCTSPNYTMTKNIHGPDYLTFGP